MLTQKPPKKTGDFICEKCDFACSKQSYWKRHLATLKHQMLTPVNNIRTGLSPFCCENCNKQYKSRVGLWKHTKQCTAAPVPSKDNNTIEDKHIINILIKENSDFKNVILELVKSNGDLQKQLVDVCKNNVGNNTINTTYSNSNNKTFNLQFFLNETCKDAMNISDFINTFDLQLTDLESVGKLGYVEGITKLMVNKLKDMDIHKRPMHCSDAKRETLYVKDEDNWEKENARNERMRKAIKQVSHKNMNLLKEWSETYPESKKSESHYNDIYMKLITQVMGAGGGSHDIEENEDKIIKKIAREVLIDKFDITC
jgi:hypothetical protein